MGYKTKVMENKSLQFEVTKTEKGGGSVKGVNLKKQVGKLDQERQQKAKEMRETQKDIEAIVKKTEKFEVKGQKLQIELGELKVLLDSLQEMEEEDSESLQALLDSSDKRR